MLKTAASLSRLGTESAFEVLARAQALMAQGKDIINLGIGQPDFKTPAHIVEAGIQALRDGHHGYTPANGIPALREAVAADLERRHGSSVDPDCVVIVPGGTTLLSSNAFVHQLHETCARIMGAQLGKANQSLRF